MASINVASVDATVVPDARGFKEKLDAQLSGLSATVDLKLVDRQVQAELDRISRDRTMTIKAKIDDKGLIGQGGRTGTEYGGAFGKSARTRIDAALRSLPPLEIGASTSEADQKIKDLSARLATLRDQRIGVDVPTEQALAEIDAIKVDLHELSMESPDITVRVNTKRATAELAAFRVELDRLASAGVQTAGGAGEGAGRAGPYLIGAGIAAGLALVGPVAGAATAAIAGFGGAVGVAALAYRGFKQEVADKTALGVATKGGIDDLTASIDHLGQIAAEAIGPGFLSGLRSITGYLGSMDSPVRALAAHLGNAFSISADGLVSALQTMQPLLNDAGVYAEKLAVKFATFAKSQDFKDFVAYARQELPQVLSMLESLTKGAIGLSKALAPLGETLVKALGGVGTAFQKIGPVLTRIGEIGSFDLSKGPKAFFDTLIHGSDDGAKATKRLDGAVKSGKQTQADYRQAIDLANTSLQHVSHATAQSEAAKRLEAQATRNQKAATDALNQAMDAEIAKQATLAGGQLAVDQALLTLTKTLKENKGAMNAHTQAGIDDRQAILGAVTALQSQRDTLIKTGTATDVATRKYGTQAQQLLDNIKRTQGADSAAYHYAQRLLKIPKDVKTAISTPGSERSTRQAINVHREIDAIPSSHTTNVRVNTGGALLGVRQVQAAINALHDRSVTITTFHQNAYNKMAGMAGMRPGYASGGLLRGPGSRTSDSIPILGSDGEYMVKAAAVEKYGVAFFDQLNAMRLAAGGPVSQRPAASAASTAVASGPMVAVYPAAHQSEQEIGTIAGREIMWRMR